MIQKLTRIEPMETIVEKEMELTPASHQKHIKIPFVLTKAYQSLYVTFSFSPQHVDREKALVIISQVLPDYFSAEHPPGRPEDFLPLENLLTFSVSHEDEYLGSRHHKATEQEVYLSAEGSSAGYLPHAVKPGNWEVQIHPHCLLSDQVLVRLTIQGGN
ncbi:hypothetical protein [uncultured Trichococcus sp.]|uniref:hypothetical protein n=1 Tax=uncultured Trichococcus sp. TaxID=189665 RepID=UPI0029C6BC63|nr:hypothetical protein [uncultured Trichococcus sp.]